MKRKKERAARQKEKEDHEKKKRMIQDYKQNKLVTEDLLQNADLDGFGAYGRMHPGGEESDEEEANQVMDQMLEQYNQMKKRPPAVV